MTEDRMCDNQALPDSDVGYRLVTIFRVSYSTREREKGGGEKDQRRCFTTRFVTFFLVPDEPSLDIQNKVKRRAVRQRPLCSRYKALTVNAIARMKPTERFKIGW